MQEPVLDGRRPDVDLWLGLDDWLREDDGRCGVYDFLDPLGECRLVGGEDDALLGQAEDAMADPLEQLAAGPSPPAHGDGEVLVWPLAEDVAEFGLAADPELLGELGERLWGVDWQVSLCLRGLLLGIEGGQEIGGSFDERLGHVEEFVDAVGRQVVRAVDRMEQLAFPCGDHVADDVVVACEPCCALRGLFADGLDDGLKF